MQTDDRPHASIITRTRIDALKDEYAWLVLLITSNSARRSMSRRQGQY